MPASIVKHGLVAAGATAKPRALWLKLSLAVALLVATLPTRVHALDAPKPQPSMQHRIEALVPDLEAYLSSGMRAFDCPGLAIGIVADGGLVYAKGFGLRSKGGAEPVDTKTIFQIGSATKAFLATTLAIAVDRGKLRWDDRLIDLDPDFRLKDPWVTREFRVFDLLAQRSGLPPYANDALALLGIGETGLIRSLRFVEPVTSFRSTFAYTNITHLLAGRVVAKQAGASDWNEVLRQQLLDPLGMRDSSYTAAAIEEAANHAEGHRWTPDGSVKVPFTEIFPYVLGGAGNVNSNIEDMSRWVRLQLGLGTFEGRRFVSPEPLAFTRTPKVGVSDVRSYAYGWVIQLTPNGTVVWHNGGTPSFGAYVGMNLDRNVGVIVLTNQSNMGFPDAVGAWTLDRLLGNPAIDYVADALKHAKAGFAAAAKQFAQPASPSPPPPLAPLAGNFANPGFGKATVALDGDALILELLDTGAKLKLEAWNGGVFTFRLLPIGKFAALAENNGPQPNGFAAFQMGKDGKLNVLRLSFDDGQAYDFTRQ